MPVTPPAFDAVDRTVEAVEVDGSPGRAVRLARTLAAAPDDVWRAITRAERIAAWFLPVEGELEVGGRFQLQGHAGGSILACEPPSRLLLTWAGGPGPETRVEVRIDPAAVGATRLALDHVGEVPGEWWERFGPAATGLGWDMMLWGLDIHLATGAPVDSAAAMAWLGTPAGAAALERGALLWAAADEATGTPAAEAEARARRTLAVYTGREEA